MNEVDLLESHEDIRKLNVFVLTFVHLVKSLLLALLQDKMMIGGLFHCFLWKTSPFSYCLSRVIKLESQISLTSSWNSEVFHSDDELLVSVTNHR